MLNFSKRHYTDVQAIAVPYSLNSASKTKSKTILKAMGRHTNQKCRQCAKTSTEEAQRRDCWASNCKQKRYYYQNREAINHDRKVKRRREALDRMPPSLEIDEVGETQIITPVLIYYRTNKESPVHAVSAELRLDGRQFTRLKPIHCKGATPAKIKAWQRWALGELSAIYGKDVGGGYRGSVEIDPSQCPLCLYESKNDLE